MASNSNSNSNSNGSSEAQTQWKDDDSSSIKKWGTHLMGEPAAPTSHPDNQMAASWTPHHQQQPYILYSPVDKPGDPVKSAIHMFNTWSNKAETAARNIWHNLRTGSSVSEAACGKFNLAAKALTEGGFEAVYKQIFTTEANEKLKKTFACYFSTTTGPVAGTLYVSTHRVAFCSDRPLSFTAPSGQQTWSYYKVMIPLASISNVNPVAMLITQNPAQNYIQITSTDGHDLWFMGFVNFEKASHHLIDSVAEFRAHPPPPPPPHI